MMYTRYCRSVLCTPATSLERYVKCHRSGADICLVDLEDSVSVRRKEEARRQAAGFFSPMDDTPRRCAVRINSVTEADGLRDLLAIQHYPVKPPIVLVPKVESPRDVEIVEQVLRPSCPQVELFAILETPRGVENAAQIARASDRLRALIFGAADYAALLGIDVDWEPLSHVRARLVNGARTADIHVIDSPTFDLADTVLVRREAELAQAMGFSGKIALNPAQVTVINEVFSPSLEQLERAARIVDAAERSADDVTTVDGGMIGRPFFEASRRLLDEFWTPGDAEHAHRVPMLAAEPGTRRHR
jgi:citrate lyase beta subunit